MRGAVRGSFQLRLQNPIHDSTAFGSPGRAVPHLATTSLWMSLQDARTSVCTPESLVQHIQSRHFRLLTQASVSWVA